MAMRCVAFDPDPHTVQLFEVEPLTVEECREHLAAKDLRRAVRMLIACRSGNGIVGFSNPAGFWTGNRRCLESKRPSTASKPIQNGGALRAPPFWIS